MASPTGVNHKTATVELGTHVRSLNSMYRDYGVGKVYKVRDGLCKVEFNPSVFSLPPFRSENFILSLDEVEICPTPLERAKARLWEEAFQCAKAHVERTAQLWDWEEDVELIGAARVVGLPAN